MQVPPFSHGSDWQSSTSARKSRRHEALGRALIKKDVFRGGDKSASVC